MRGAGPGCLPTCILLDSGEGRMEGLGHGRALSCGQTEGLNGVGAAEVFHPPSTPSVRARRRARNNGPSFTSA